MMHVKLIMLPLSTCRSGPPKMDAVGTTNKYSKIKFMLDLFGSIIIKIKLYLFPINDIEVFTSFAFHIWSLASLAFGVGVTSVFPKRNSVCACNMA